MKRFWFSRTGPGQSIAVDEGTDDTNLRFFTMDQQGSVAATTSSAGTLRTIYDYDEYGKPLTATGTDVSRFRYTGQVYLPEVDLYNYKARMYDPKIGRFLQTDPIGYGDGLNWYAYVHNDPVNRADILGTCPGCLWSPTDSSNPVDPDGGTIVVITFSGGNCRSNCIDYWRSAMAQPIVPSDQNNWLAAQSAGSIYVGSLTSAAPGQCSALQKQAGELADSDTCVGMFYHI